MDPKVLLVKGSKNSSTIPNQVIDIPQVLWKFSLQVFLDAFKFGIYSYYQKQWGELPIHRNGSRPIVESSVVRPSGPRVQGLCRRLGYQEDEAFGPFPGRRRQPPIFFFFSVVFWLLSFFFSWHLIDPHTVNWARQQSYLFFFASLRFTKVSSIFWLIPWPFFSACFLLASRGLPKAVPFSITSPNGTVRGIRVTPTKISHRVLYLHGSLERQNGGRRFAYLSNRLKQGESSRQGIWNSETVQVCNHGTMQL